MQTRVQQYWRDVGTVDAFYEANMELVHVNPELNIYDEQWPIWTYQRQYPPAKFVLDDDGRRGMAVNSMVSGGCIISGAQVNQSLLFSNVRVDERSYIERSVIFPDVRVGAGSVIKRAIIDTGGDVPAGTQIGVNREEDARRFYMSEKGVALVTRDMLAQFAQISAAVETIAQLRCRHDRNCKCARIDASCCDSLCLLCSASGCSALAPEARSAAADDRAASP